MWLFLENIFKKKIGLFVLALLVAAIPLTVFIAQEQQELRQRAQVPTVTLKLVPQSGSIGLNATQTINVVLDAGNAPINGVDFKVSFSKDTLEIINFQPSSSLTAVINNPPNNTDGTFRFVGVNANTGGPQLTGSIPVGTFSVKGKSVGTGTINFGGTLITSPDQSEGVTTNKLNGTYAITQGGGGGGGNQVGIFFAKNGAPVSQITVPQGSFTVDLMIDTRQNNVNAFDISVAYGGELTLQSITDGADTSKFPSEIFKTINNQAHSLRYSRVTTNTSATNNGRFHIGTLNFQTTALGTGAITFGTTLVTSSSQTGSLTIDTIPLSYTISDVPITITPPPTGQIQLLLTLTLTGIGLDGGNISPLRPERQVFVTATDRQNQTTEASGFVTYDKASGLFKGTVSLPETLAQGAYTIKVRSSQYLTKLIPGIQNFTSGEYSLTPVALVVGDINGDNKVDIIDYNFIFSCYAKKMGTSSCTSKEGPDLNDDGKIDGVDYNLFVRSLAVKQGD